LNSTNTALGTVIGGTLYDANRGTSSTDLERLPTFSSKIEMENYQFSASTAPSTSALFPIELARNQTPLNEMYLVTDEEYDQSVIEQSPGDKRFNDVGTFVLATVGMQQADVNIGELWCTYEVEFLKPRLNQSITEDVPTYHLEAHTVVENSPFDAVDRESASNIAVSRVEGNGSEIKLGPQKGTYLLLVNGCIEEAAPGSGNQIRLDLITPTDGTFTQLAMGPGTLYTTNFDLTALETDSVVKCSRTNLFKWEPLGPSSSLVFSFAWSGFASSVGVGYVSLTIIKVSDDIMSTGLKHMSTLTRVQNLEAELKQLTFHIYIYRFSIFRAMRSICLE